MKNRYFAGIFVALVFALGALWPARVSAQSVADFYRGRTITILVAFSAGGGYGLYSRVLSRTLPDHIPGKPGFVLQFMPGAGGLKAANYFANVAPRDGSLIGLLSNAAPFFQVVSGKAKYDASTFNYIGRVNSMNQVLMVWHTAPAKTIEQVKRIQVVIGATGKAGQSYMNPTLLKNLLGFKLKVIAGYRGAAGMNKAMEQGETQGRVGDWTSWKAKAGAWLRDKKIVPLVEIGLQKSPDLPGVPLVLDLAKTTSDRKVLEFFAGSAAVGRAFVAPPDVPAGRVTALRRAFDATMKDPKFVKEARDRRLGVDPLPGVKLQKIVVKVVSTPANLVEKTKQALK